MVLITVSGPPSSGKTSVILQTIRRLQADRLRVGVVKFDCLSTSDRPLYEKAGVPVIVGVSGNQCPDHYFVSNIEDCVRWGNENHLDFLISESAGLCNRCSPHIRDVFSVCVIDNLSGVDTPRKIGPMLKLADAVIITKGDIVSQAEREVFILRVMQVNSRAVILPINGITGQGVADLEALFRKAPIVKSLEGRSLRFSMPAALCSYCLGQTKIGADYQRGNVRKMNFAATSEIPDLAEQVFAPKIAGKTEPNSMKTILEKLPEESVENFGLSREELQLHFEKYAENLATLKHETSLHSLSIKGGHDKSGNPENIFLTLKPGDVLCIVGPTGSGKSRLLADLECLAQKDTPTGREILIDGQSPSPSERFSLRNKLIAQLSQNMNFVMDLSVEAFLLLHAESRKIENAKEIVRAIVKGANELAGEKFGADSPLTELSGGQSRALMIADTAYLSASPVVLIDEIENAGIDRSKAFRLLARKNKIVLMSTHDPLLALLCPKRILIGNGAIRRIVESSPEEKQILTQLEQIDSYQSAVRHALRNGETLPENPSWIQEELYASI